MKGAFILVVVALGATCVRAETSQEPTKAGDITTALTTSTTDTYEELVMTEDHPNVEVVFDPPNPVMETDDAISVIMNISFPENWTLTDACSASAESTRDHIVEVSSDVFVMKVNGTNVLIVTFDLESFKHYGATEVLVSTTVLTEKKVLIIVKAMYIVGVERLESKSSLQKALGYVAEAMCLVALFLVGCDLRLSDLLGGELWMAACLLLQAIFIPVLAVAIVEVFHIENLQVLGILTVAFSPSGLLVVPFAAVLKADMALVVGLVVFSYLVAIVSMPLWSLQLTRLATLKVHLHAGSVPFGPLFLLAFASTVAAGLGMLVYHFWPNAGRMLRSALAPFSWVTIAYVVIAMVCSGSDLLSLLPQKVGLVCCTWTVITLAIVVIIFVSTPPATLPRVKASAVFLVIKSLLYSLLFLDMTMSQSLADAASVGAFFFSFMSVLCVLTLSLAYGFYRCWLKLENEDDRDKLVYEVQPEGGATVTSATDWENSYENLPAYSYYDSNDQRIVNGALNASALGAPTVGWIGL